MFHGCFLFLLACLYRRFRVQGKYNIYRLIGGTLLTEFNRRNRHLAQWKMSSEEITVAWQTYSLAITSDRNKIFTRYIAGFSSSNHTETMQSIYAEYE